MAEALSKARLSAPPLELSDLDVPALGSDVIAAHPSRGGPPLFIQARQDRLETASDAATWVTRRREVLDALILEHGGIVLRGFPVRSAEDFDEVISAFPQYQAGY